MRANRQDAWTIEEDQLLAHTVIDYIKKGYTQLESFKHVAKQLNRTPAACGFRWNATIRRKHTRAIDLAKQSRKKAQYHELVEERDAVKQENKTSLSTLDHTIHWLENLRDESRDPTSHSEDKLSQQMQDENKQLQEELMTYQKLMNHIKKIIEVTEAETKAD